LEHVSAQDFGPEIFDLAGLGEKPVAADVEAVPAVINGARDATDILRIALEHNNRSTLLGEFVGGGQARGSGSNDDGLGFSLVHGSRP